MSISRQKMLARYRFEAMDADQLTAEADDVTARAEAVLRECDVDLGNLFPEGPADWIERSVDLVRIALQQLAEARKEVPGEPTMADAVAELQGALVALEAAKRAARATKQNSPGTIAGVRDAASAVGPMTVAGVPADADPLANAKREAFDRYYSIELERANGDAALARARATVRLSELVERVLVRPAGQQAGHHDIATDSKHSTFETG